MARACRNMGLLAEAHGYLTEAISQFRTLRDPLRAGDALQTLSSVTQDLGDSAAGTQLTLEAIDLLEQQPPGSELVWAYSDMGGNLAFVHGRF